MALSYTATTVTDILLSLKSISFMRKPTLRNINYLPGHI